MSATNINISEDVFEFDDHELLQQILLELRKLNTQLSLITDHELTEEDTR
jgi:hypothetical protein